MSIKNKIFFNYSQYGRIRVELHIFGQKFSSRRFNEMSVKNKDISSDMYR